MRSGRAHEARTLWDPAHVTLAPGRTCVLLSGGVDSAVVLALLADREPHALWVDYGQPAAAAERRASRSIASHYSVRWLEVSLAGLQPPAAGEFPGRNDLLVAAAVSASGAASVALGIHAGTGYVDCSPGWAAAWQQLLDRQHHGRASLLAPLVDFSKAQVYALAADLAVPVALTHSCEASPDPCGACSSCLDRGLVHARP